MWSQIAFEVLLKQERKDIQNKFTEYEEIVAEYENSGWDTSIMKDTPILGLWDIFMRDYHSSLKSYILKLFLPLKFRIERLMIAEFLLSDKSSSNMMQDRKQLYNCEWLYKIPLFGENQCVQCRGTGADYILYIFFMY